jgi:hypothetical protein
MQQRVERTRLNMHAKDAPGDVNSVELWGSKDKLPSRHTSHQELPSDPAGRQLSANFSYELSSATPLWAVEELDLQNTCRTPDRELIGDDVEIKPGLRSLHFIKAAESEVSFHHDQTFINQFLLIYQWLTEVHHVQAWLQFKNVSQFDVGRSTAPTFCI